MAPTPKPPGTRRRRNAGQGHRRLPRQTPPAPTRGTEPGRSTRRRHAGRRKRLPLADGDMRDVFYAALKAAGLGHLRDQEEPIVFHDLRHTFGTLAVQMWPLSDVQAYMGHEDIKTTMRYVHHVPKTDAAAKGSAFIAAQMAPAAPADLCPEICPERGDSGDMERNSAHL